MIRNTVDNSSLSSFLRRCLFRWNLLRYQASNNAFKNNNPGFPMPPDSLLFETGSLHYHSFQKSGQEAATEIESLCKIFGHAPIQSILDWGCGTGRVTRHLPDYFPGAKITGGDLNPSGSFYLVGTDVVGDDFSTLANDTLLRNGNAFVVAAENENKILKLAPQNP